MSIVYVHYDIVGRDNAGQKAVQKFQTGPFGTKAEADAEIAARKQDGAVNAAKTHLNYDDRIKVAPKVGKILTKAA